MSDVDALIETLQLQPHPEGGYYRETYRSPAAGGARGACTAIHYLLRAGQRSHWHRVDADEVWCFHAGDRLELLISDGETTTIHVLAADESPQVVVPAGAWQAARPLGAYALVSCIVAPAFRFEGFELAPADWAPADRR
ncbi:MAG: cupin domain-containing protein [Myxococcota bacterium]